MAECIKCGDCCEVIPFSMTKKQVAEAIVSGKFSGKNLESLKFIKKYWKRLYKKDFSKREREIFGYPNSQYKYTCSMFNSKTRLCEAHDKRPSVCYDYPWYNAEPDSSAGLPLGCSYREDIGEVVVQIKK
jgi:Fe-S-cluster containining protein